VLWLRVATHLLGVGNGSHGIMRMKLTSALRLRVRRPRKNER